MKKIDSLRVAQVDKARADQTCGPYYYLVTQGAGSFTAFRTRYGFLRWLHLHGLELSEPLAKKGEVASQAIRGHYYEQHMSPDAFESFISPNSPKSCYKLVNARYVPAIAYRAEEDNAMVIVYPWSGIGEEPTIDYWTGHAIEDGLAVKGRTPGPDWIFGTPEEIVSKGQSIPEESLSETEMALLTRAWLSLDEDSTEEVSLVNSSIMRRMIFC